MKDSLGDRIKRYENVFVHRLPPRSPVIVRVDGRAFHTWTKRVKCVRPFDERLSSSMVVAMQQVAQQISGFKLAYTQSDEVTFLFTDYDKLDTQGWFDYNLNKLVSITASAMTASFNWSYHDVTMPVKRIEQLAQFDARAFTVPREDIANVFLWRQKDWVRNSVQMLAQAHFTHHQLRSKKQPEMHEMLHSKGINWNDLPPQYKNGVFTTGYDTLVNILPNYEAIDTLLTEVLAP